MPIKHVDRWDIHPWVPPSVHRKERERGPGLELSRVGEFLRVQWDWPGQWGPVWAVAAVSPWSYSWRLNQDNPANYETGMRYKYTGMGKWSLWNQAQCQSLGVNTKMWWPSYTARHRPGSRCLLLFYAKIMHEGLASETKRQASARENKCQLSHFKQCDYWLFKGEGVAGRKSISFIYLICVCLMKIWMNILPDANWLWSGLMWPGGWELSPVSSLGWPGGLLVTLSLLSRLSLVTASLFTSHSGLAMGPSQSG